MSEPVRKSRRIAAAGEKKVIDTEESNLIQLVNRVYQRYFTTTTEQARGDMEVVLAAADSMKDTLALKNCALNGEGRYRGLSEDTRKRLAVILSFEAAVLMLGGGLELRRVGVDESDREEVELRREQ